MFVPSQEAWENIEWSDVGTWVNLNEEMWYDLWVSEEGQIVLPEIDPENPENTSAPILVTEDGEIDEMDLTREIQLENGEVEIVREWDLLWDAIQIAQ